MLQTEREGYSYSEEYQQKMASFIIRDPSFLTSYPDVVDPFYFDYDYLVSIVRLVRDIMDQHHVLPTRASLSQSIIEYCNDTSVDEDTTKTLLTSVEQLFSIDVSDGPIIEERIINFGRRQALRSGVIQLASLSNKNPEYYDQGRDIMDTVLSVGHNVSDMGLNFFHKADVIPSMVAEDSAYSVVKRVPTGIPTIDRCTKGGPGRKQVWVVMGLPGGGKSHWVINTGGYSLMRGLNVAHVTLGDLHEEDVAVRYAARLTGLSQDDVVAGDPRYYSRIQQIAQRGGSLRIKYYPSKIASMDTIKAWLMRLRSIEGFVPALLIIDYADELAEMDSDNTYKAADRVYARMNQVACMFDCLVWTGSQVNRYNTKHGEEDIITKFNIADSWAKAMKADGMISVNQTEFEYANNLMRVWLDKVRRGKSFVKVKCSADFSMSLIRELSEQDPAPGKKIIAPPPIPRVLAGVAA